jgi:hypothetical protein
MDESRRQLTPLSFHVRRHGDELSEDGHAIAQEVSSQLPTAVAQVRPRFRPCGISGAQIGTGVGFPQVLQFPLPILIPPIAPHSSSIIQGRYNRPVSGRRTKWTQSHPTLTNQNNKPPEARNQCITA